MNSIRRPRLVIDLDEETERRLNKFFRWGDRSAFFRFVVLDILDILDGSPEHARAIMGAYMLRKIGIADLSPLIKTGGQSDESKED